MNELELKKSIYRILTAAAGYDPDNGLGFSRKEAIDELIMLIDNVTVLPSDLEKKLDTIVRMVVAYSDGYPGYKVGAATIFAYDVIVKFVK